jgi:hypothetical protein
MSSRISWRCGPVRVLGFVHKCAAGSGVGEGGGGLRAAGAERVAGLHRVVGSASVCLREGREGAVVVVCVVGVRRRLVSLFTGQGRESGACRSLIVGAGSAGRHARARGGFIQGAGSRVAAMLQPALVRLGPAAQLVSAAPVYLFACAPELLLAACMRCPPHAWRRHMRRAQRAEHSRSSCASASCRAFAAAGHSCLRSCSASTILEHVGGQLQSLHACRDADVKVRVGGAMRLRCALHANPTAAIIALSAVIACCVLTFGLMSAACPSKQHPHFLFARCAIRCGLLRSACVSRCGLLRSACHPVPIMAHPTSSRGMHVHALHPPMPGVQCRAGTQDRQRGCARARMCVHVCRDCMHRFRSLGRALGVARSLSSVAPAACPGGAVCCAAWPAWRCKRERGRVLQVVAGEGCGRAAYDGAGAVALLYQQHTNCQRCACTCGVPMIGQARRGFARVRGDVRS